jgi:putative hydroxymethylpyrimidine transport system substrate-binding protein
MKTIRIFILLFITILYTSKVNANDKITLLLDWFINPDHGPIIIAKQKGIFEDAGLEVKIIPPANPADPPKLVAAGKADIAISYQPQLHMQIHEGLPLTRIGTLVATPLNCLLVLENGPIKKLSDLKGKKIGYSISGMEQALLSAILKKANVSKSDVEYINVNWSLSPSLMSKQVDAVIGAYRNFELNQMKIEGVKGKCFYIEEEGVPPYDELIFIINNKNIDKNMLTKFLDSIEKATQYIINHPTESWGIFSNYSKELNNELNEMAWFDTIPRFALRPAALDKRRYNRFEEFLYEEGLIDNKYSFEKMAIEIY